MPSLCLFVKIIGVLFVKCDSIYILVILFMYSDFVGVLFLYCGVL